MPAIRKALLTVICLVLVGCGSARFFLPGANITTQSVKDTQTEDLSGQKYGKGDLVVFAAASLSGAFKEIGRSFEDVNPGVKVNFNFAGSQILRTQLEQGASADVYASADHKNMDALSTDQLVDPTGVRDFATNSLVVILPKGNAAGIRTLSDLARPGVKIILADPSVPAGNYARQSLAKMSADPAFGTDFSQKVLANLVSNETDVKQVVAKLELGEADAGIVYVSDASAAPDLENIPIPVQLNVTAVYPIAVLKSAHQPDIARAFIEYVLSSSGQEILKKWGFTGVDQ